MRTLITTAAMLVLVSITVLAADVAGAWRLTVSFDAASVSKGSPAEVKLACDIARQRNTLTGSCRGASQPDTDRGAPVIGHVHGSAVEWQFDIALEPDAPKHTATFRGALAKDGRAIKGTCSIADRAGTFAATRR